jgi:hypothetical protein
LAVCLVLIFNPVLVEQPFHIWFERSGGFTGISNSVEIDSKSLSAEEAKKLGQLVDQSGFFEVHKIDSATEELPDQFQYKITIEYEDNRHTLTFAEATVPESFRPSGMVCMNTSPW